MTDQPPIYLSDKELEDLRGDYLGMKCSDDIIAICDELIARRKAIPTPDRDGMNEDLNQLIRVCLTNPADASGFIQANYPKQYAAMGDALSPEARGAGTSTGACAPSPANTSEIRDTGVAGMMGSGRAPTAPAGQVDTSPQQPDEFTLLSVLADIRSKTGIGDKPMLSELADVLAALIQNGDSAIETNKLLAARLREREAVKEYDPHLPGGCPIYSEAECHQMRAAYETACQNGAAYTETLFAPVTAVLRMRGHLPEFTKPNEADEQGRRGRDD
ncbi:hypothetical protein [Fimbriiglobus ruber]|uniref:hypothetical protein n=1 Tax=Fimbriiglobus ruber TaxID=1908690 RepID=UPI001179E7F2|nr:hypothetical protein [Fimbriiglobus ruber]